MILCIFSSMRNVETVKDVIERLEKLGLKVVNRDLFFVEKAKEEEEKMRFIKRHLEALKRVDLVYVINPDGYVGESVILEIGEALALDKPIIFSNATNSVD